MAGRLDQKVGIITGAASGQGRVAAELFAREGARLVLADLDAEGLAEVAVLARKAGGDPMLYEGNLTEEKSNREMVEGAVSRYGRVDVLYNAAGRVRFAQLHETSLEDWRFTLENELTITFLGCKFALRAMLETGSGSIINISSGSALHGIPTHAAHAATKAGLIGLTRQIAVRLRPAGHPVQCHRPGLSGLRTGAASSDLEDARPLAQRDSFETVYAARGYRLLRPLPGLRRGELRHWPGACRGRRKFSALIPTMLFQISVVVPLVG